MTNTEILADRAVGSVYGLAYGDAIGDPLEFRKYPEILAAGGASVPARFRITDDTQMSLAVWSALDAWDPASGFGMLRLEIAAAFQAWRVDPDNDRAPGTTCLTSLDRLAKVGLGHWTTATSPTSAGCGSVMRAPWIGLHPKVADADVATVAALQAVLTHGPAENAYVAAAAAELARVLASGEIVAGEAAEWLATWTPGDHAYDDAALSDVWRHARTSDDGSRYGSPEAYVADGIGHVGWVVDRAGDLAAMLAADPWGFDPCAVAGEAWRARECLAVAVGILDGFARQPGSLQEVAVDMLVRAAETNGDSDSIGAVTGALAGAAFGNVWPTSWLLRLESRYQHELARVAGSLA